MTGEPTLPSAKRIALRSDHEHRLIVELDTDTEVRSRCECGFAMNFTPTFRDGKRILIPTGAAANCAPCVGQTTR